MSQQDTYDMKPEAPAESRGPYAPIATSAPGIQITERFPRQAPLMDRLSIARSVNHQNAIHAPSAHWMQTGYFGPTLARNAPQKPSFGPVIARCRGARRLQMPRSHHEVNLACGGLTFRRNVFSLQSDSNIGVCASYLWGGCSCFRIWRGVAWFGRTVDRPFRGGFLSA